MTLRQMIRRLAAKAGYSTTYHVAAAYNRDSYVGHSIVSLTVDVKPWVHTDNYAELVDYVKSQATKCAGNPIITSVTKLGV